MAQVNAVRGFVRTGALVSWPTWCGTATALVASVQDYGITLIGSDGFSELHPTTEFIDLDRLTENFRPATDEDAAAFKDALQAATGNAGRP